ncbi:MAG: 2-C-methyl-D-erythritol 4-phosphate cytidylyltransferase [Candidatus Kapaibacterium sp.]
MNFYLIIPASGSGNRFGLKTPKQFYRTEGKEIIVHTLNRFNSVKDIKSIFVSAKKEHVNRIYRLAAKYKLNKVRNVVIGGKLRQDSVYNALMSIDAVKGDRIIIHDAVRPYFSVELLKRLMQESIKYDCVIPALQITDTIKLTDNKNNVVCTVPRKNLWSVQTPQIFEYSRLVKAFALAMKEKFIGTDEASLMEYAGYKVRIVEGEKANIKITTRKDIV